MFVLWLVAQMKGKLDETSKIPAWDGDQGLMVKDNGWTARLEELGVFFSTPLDLDFLIMQADPAAYKIIDEDLEEPDEVTIIAVLGLRRPLGPERESGAQLLRPEGDDRCAAGRSAQAAALASSRASTSLWVSSLRAANCWTCRSFGLDLPCSQL